MAERKPIKIPHLYCLLFMQTKIYLEKIKDQQDQFLP